MGPEDETSRRTRLVPSSIGSDMSGDAHLWLIRHAPAAGPSGIIHDLDVPADTSDVAAFAALQAQLPPHNITFCSPARRAWQTALALGLSPIKEPALREQDFGAWTGGRHNDLARECGATYENFWRLPARRRPPDGESFVDQVARVAATLAALPAGDIVLVAHSGTIRAALAVALDIAPDTALQFVIDALSLTRIDRLDSCWRIVAVNRLHNTFPAPPV